MEQLESLTLYFCQVKHPQSRLFKKGSLRQLRNLSVLMVDISGEHLAFLNDCPELRGVTIHSSESLGDSVASSLAKCQKLQSVSLDPTQITHSGFKALCGVPSIEKLSIEESLIDDLALESIAALTKLQTLTLGHSRISSRGIRQCSLPTSLTELSIYPTLVHVKDLGAMPNRVREMLMQSLTSSWGGGLRVWDASTGDIRMLGARNCRASDLTLLNDRKTIVADLGGMLAWLDLKTGRNIRSYTYGLSFGSLTSAATCPNGEIMAVGSVDEINIIDLNTGNTTLTLATQGAQHKIRFSDDGRYLAVVTKKPESFGSQTNILDLDDHGKVIQSVDGWDAVLSPNSKYVAFRDSGFIYQIGSNDHGLSTENLNLQFLNDSRAIIERRTATTPEIGLFEIYDVENERRLSRLDIHSDGYRSVWAASPDGTLVAKWEDKSIVVYNTTTGQRQATIDATLWVNHPDDELSGSFLFIDSNTLIGTISDFEATIIEFCVRRSLCFTRPCRSSYQPALGNAELSITFPQIKS